MDDMKVKAEPCQGGFLGLFTLDGENWEAVPDLNADYSEALAVFESEAEATAVAGMELLERECSLHGLRPFMTVKEYLSADRL